MHLTMTFSHMRVKYFAQIHPPQHVFCNSKTGYKDACNTRLLDP